MKSRSFIDLGVEWQYIIDGDVETLHTDGPLHDPVVVLVTTLFIFMNLLSSLGRHLRLERTGLLFLGSWRQLTF